MAVEIPDGYVRLEDAVRLTNVSEKTIRNWAERQIIGKRKWKGLALYSRRDLEEQAAKMAETKIVKDNPYAAPVIPQITEAIASVMAQRALPGPAPQEDEEELPLADLAVKRYLTLKEAIRYSGLGEFYITEKLEGKPIGPRASLVYKRADLDKL